MVQESNYVTAPQGASRRVTDFHGLLSAAPQIKQLTTLVERVARAQAAVLVRGETGSGKELIAHAIHKLSPRASGPFRAVNCATLTPELLASELFGHVKGAFTGAIQDKKGLFELADGGTIFLDEIAETPMDVQARLLRVLQEQTFIPVGGTKPIKVDVRVVSATHQSLREAVEQRRFRADLMYRIRVIPLFLPPLRERTGDVDALLWAFLERLGKQHGHRTIKRVSVAALEALRAYAWPGNVRELINALEYAAIVGVGDTLELDDLPPEFSQPAQRAASPSSAQDASATATTSGEDPERARYLAVLESVGWRRQDAAQRLGVSRSTLWRRMRELGLS
jgi:transcriptional regulator with PAS, ATPase and Fis domain